MKIRRLSKALYLRVILAVSLLFTMVSAGGWPAPALAADGVGPYMTGLFFPKASIWMGTHLWQSEEVTGLCRVDNGQLNMTTCVAEAEVPGQVVMDTRPRVSPDDGTRWVYISDMSSKRSEGVHRYVWHPDTETLDSHVMLKNDPAMVRSRMTGLALDSAGNLYVSSIRLDVIWRINNPHLAPTDPLQTVETVAVTASGGGVLGGFGVINRPPNAAGRVVSDLYIAEDAAITMISDIATCSAQNFCIPSEVPMTVIGPMAITSDGSNYIYVADTPEPAPGSILRYNPWTDTTDVYSQNHPPITLPDGSVITRYSGVAGMSLNPSNGDLYVATDWSLDEAVPGGDVWVVPGGSAPDILGQPGQPAFAPPAPGIVNGKLMSWGQTAPDGGVVWLPGALGGHWWAGDHSQGFCRLDPVPGTTLLAYNTDVCDDETMGSPGSAVYDPRENVGIPGVPDGTHFVYVAQNDVASPGIWRFVFDPQTETMVGSPVIMAPGKVAGIRTNSLVMGPDGDLYVAGVRSNIIYRINDPMTEPRFQQVDQIGQTRLGGGIEGTIGFIGNDLYLPEETEVSVIRGAVNCPTVISPETATSPAVTQLCTPQALPIQVVGATGLTTDPMRGYVYVADAPGPVPATIWRYDLGRQETIAYTTLGELPPLGTPEATIWCSLSCTRTENKRDVMGQPNAYRSVLGLTVDPLTGDLFVADDPLEGGRGGRGHVYRVPLSDVPGADMVLTMRDENVMQINGLPLIVGDYVSVTLSYAALNTDPTVVETAVVTVITDSEPNGVPLTLTEATANGTAFTGRFQLAAATNTTASPLQVKAADFDTLRVVYPSLPAPTQLQATDTVDPTGFTGLIEAVDTNEGFLVLGDPITVTLFDTDLNNPAVIDSITIPVTSDTDKVGIQLLLTETGLNTAQFEGMFRVVDKANPTTHTAATDLTPGINPGWTDTMDLPLLRTAVGETVVATYDEQLDAFGMNPPPEFADRIIQPAGRTGTLTFTDLNGGALLVGDSVTVTLTDGDLNTDPATVQTVTQVIDSSGSAVGLTLTLTETGADTGIFTGTFQIAGVTDSALNQLQAAAGDRISARYNDQLNGLGVVQTVETTVTVAP